MFPFVTKMYSTSYIKTFLISNLSGTEVLLSTHQQSRRQNAVLILYHHHHHHHPICLLKGGRVFSLSSSILNRTLVFYHIQIHHSSFLLLTQSIHLFLALPLGLLPISVTHLIMSSSSRLFTCPYHLSLQRLSLYATLHYWWALGIYSRHFKYSDTQPIGMSDILNIILFASSFISLSSLS